MRDNWVQFIGRVIDRYEGPYGWNKSDPGGPTKYGITCFDLAEHRGLKMTSMVKWAPIVKAMTLQEAEDIYAIKYATGLYFEALRSGPDCAIADYGINSGIGRPLLVARRLLNFTNPSNPALIAAINVAHDADPKWFIDALCQERLHFMHQIRGGSAWAEFGKGWGARVADVDAYSDSLANITPMPLPPAPPTVIHPKVIHGTPNTNTKVVTNAVTAGAGSAAAAHVSGAPTWAIPAIVGGVALAGIGYALYAAHQTRTANASVVIPPGGTPMPAAVAAALGVPHVPAPA